MVLTIEFVQLINRSKWFHGLAANITWALLSIERLGVILFDVQIIFVPTMIIIGIGHYSMYLNNVYVTNCMQWWLKGPEYFTSVNGELLSNQKRFIPLITIIINYHWILILFEFQWRSSQKEELWIKSSDFQGATGVKNSNKIEAAVSKEFNLNGCQRRQKIEIA